MATAELECLAADGPSAWIPSCPRGRHECARGRVERPTRASVRLRCSAAESLDTGWSAGSALPRRTLSAPPVGAISLIAGDLSALVAAQFRGSVVTNDLYSRSRLAGYEPDRLHSARVLVIGAGSLAQPLLENLALSGVGELRVVDRDRFEPHNRAKSSHYPHHLATRPGAELPLKAEWVAGQIAQLATAPRAVVRFANSWIQDLGAAAFENLDAVVSCADAISARRYVARRATEFDLPLITGGFKAERLWYSVYPVSERRNERACWNCEGVPEEDVFSCRHYAREAENAGVIPAIQTGAATLAGFMAEATIMLLHGREATARSVAIDLRSGESILSRPVFDPECASRHRGAPDAESVDLDPTRGTCADLASMLSVERMTLTLTATFVATAACRTCHRTARVNAPLWAWEAQPHCRRRGCDGPWDPLASHAVQAPPITASEVRLDQPLADVPLAALGIAPGDIVSIYADRRHRTIKLGSGRNLFAVTAA
jgi:molybdopterin/thiamine biosynthesis adenylyltransferase